MPRRLEFGTSLHGPVLAPPPAAKSPLVGSRHRLGLACLAPHTRRSVPVVGSTSRSASRERCRTMPSLRAELETRRRVARRSWFAPLRIAVHLHRTESRIPANSGGETGGGHPAHA